MQAGEFRITAFVLPSGGDCKETEGYSSSFFSMILLLLVWGFYIYFSGFILQIYPFFIIGT